MTLAYYREMTSDLVPFYTGGQLIVGDALRVLVGNVFEDMMVTRIDGKVRRFAAVTTTGLKIEWNTDTGMTILNPFSSKIGIKICGVLKTFDRYMFSKQYMRVEIAPVNQFGEFIFNDLRSKVVGYIDKGYVVCGMTRHSIDKFKYFKSIVS